MKPQFGVAWIILHSNAAARKIEKIDRIIFLNMNSNQASTCSLSKIPDSNQILVNFDLTLIQWWES